ncbi:hypothetical protein K378_03816 [Streptomyces sp. Amel2xB2]|uniref:alpha/beta hydrolase n=1 Tax=Streptomyces sp. Amel2xB2 TaxID=1305829 RepID=UPI000DBFD232|nr:alpha/beta hydrolase [Streptomyces sp. Amel2xB2]RAJ62465.1 hypothetical protein K378_03816 [Streptomyces sp. Amel2xB2]
MSEKVTFPSQGRKVAGLLYVPDRIAQHDAWELIDAISPRPLLMIAGSDADTLGHSQTAIDRVKEPKELFVVDGASHVDLYDERVGDVAPKLVEFFTANL